MLEQYIGILIFIFVGLAIGVGPILVGKLLASNAPDPEKNSPYECGFEPFEDARMKFDIHFYLLAILFIIFDLEIAFLFPWAVILDDATTTTFVAMAIFIIELLIGYIYLWSKGALEWE